MTEQRTVTETYFLFAAEKKGKISGSDPVRTMCLLTAALYELSAAGYLEFRENEVSPLNGSATLPAYLAQVRKRLREMSSMEYKEIMRDYNNGWTDYHLNRLTMALGDDLAGRGLATKAKLGVLLNTRTYFIPRRDVLAEAADSLRDAVASPDPLPTETGFLWLLLEKSELLPAALTEEEKLRMSRRLRLQCDQDPESELAKLDALTERFLSLSSSHTYEGTQYLKQKQKRSSR